MLNAIGLANPGRERFLADHLPRLRELGIPLWVSVGGFCAERLRRDLRALWTGSRRSSSTFRVRMSTRQPGRRRRSWRPAALRPRCRSTRSFPLRIPTSHPWPAQSRTQVQTASRSINTLRGLALDPHTLQPDPRTRRRRVSPALRSSPSRSRPCTRATPRRSSRSSAWAASRPAQDVVEFVACGALHVALGTVLFSDPDAPTRIREELAVVPMDDKLRRRAHVRKTAGVRRKSPRLIAAGTLVVSSARPCQPRRRQHTHPFVRSTSAWTL